MPRKSVKSKSRSQKGQGAWMNALAPALAPVATQLVTGLLGKLFPGSGLRRKPKAKSKKGGCMCKR